VKPGSGAAEVALLGDRHEVPKVTQLHGAPICENHRFNRLVHRFNRLAPARIPVIA
jgi:hypothetical protein